MYIVKARNYCGIIWSIRWNVMILIWLEIQTCYNLPMLSHIESSVLWAFLRRKTQTSPSKFVPSDFQVLCYTFLRIKKVFPKQQNAHSQTVKLTDAIGFAWLLKRFVCQAKPVVSHRMENMGRQNGKNIYIIIRYYRFCGIYCRSTRRCAQKHFNFMQTNCKFVLGQNKQKTFSKIYHFLLVTFMLVAPKNTRTNSKSQIFVQTLANSR